MLVIPRIILENKFTNRHGKKMSYVVAAIECNDGSAKTAKIFLSALETKYGFNTENIECIGEEDFDGDGNYYDVLSQTVAVNDRESYTLTYWQRNE